MHEAHEITDLLSRLRGDSGAVVDELFERVYGELRAIAARRLEAERADHTLSTTALVHEAYIKLVGQDRVEWQNRAHFFAIAAQAMRRILIDYAVARNAKKRGGGIDHVTLGDEDAGRTSDLDELIAIDQALGRLSDVDERQGKVVELRFFGGLKLEEIAEVLGVSLASVNRDWRTARAFLTAELRA